MPRNRELFLKIADVIEKHPELHDQGTWGDYQSVTECGTAQCIAGHACALSGCTPRVLDGSGNRWSWTDVHMPGDPNGHIRYCPDMAKELLGLGDVEAATLFHANWQPPEGKTVPQALRDIAEGGNI